MKFRKLFIYFRSSDKTQVETSSQNNKLGTNHDLMTSSNDPPSDSSSAYRIDDAKSGSNDLKNERNSIQNFKNLQALRIKEHHFYSSLGLNDPEVDIKFDIQF